MNDQLLDIGDEEFTLESHGVFIKVKRLGLPGHTAFKVSFSSSRKPLVVARAHGADRPVFWTSVPEGRQKEAEGVGALIEEYIKTKK